VHELQVDLHYTSWK